MCKPFPAAELFAVSTVCASFVHIFETLTFSILVHTLTLFYEEKSGSIVSQYRPKIDLKF